MPWVKSHDSFKTQVKRLKWIDCLLEHISVEDDKDDAAEWLTTYLGKRYEGPFMLASKALGVPLVQQLDAPSAEAMWSDANINVVQQ